MLLGAVQAIRHEMRVRHTNPYTCRKADDHAHERALIVPLVRSGHVALFEIISDTEVVASALRHQREDD